MTIPSDSRQAVLIIHGMGQPRPWKLAPRYAEAIASESDLVFYAPDVISGQSDMRRAKVVWSPPVIAGQEAGPPTPYSTDFYEFYWAHLVKDTRLISVVWWIVGLLRHPTRISPVFGRFVRSNWPALVFAVALIVGIAAVIDHVFGAVEEPWWLGPALWSALAVVMVRWLVNILGDVPRYLARSTANVAAQREVRNQGVELLKQLHEPRDPTGKQPRYERVIVMGHSLGSVIAYDIVRDYWSTVYGNYETTDGTAEDLKDLADRVDVAGERLWAAHHAMPGEDLAAPVDEIRAEYKDLQGELAKVWEQYACAPANPAEKAEQWAVTDLVTLACPLTHADSLLARSRRDLEDEQWKRSLATCPPQRQTGRPTYRFANDFNSGLNPQAWHQAALFAPTRWTNVYFSTDFVGGPLRRLFGPGIDDRKVSPTAKFSKRYMPRVHLQYPNDPRVVDIMRGIVHAGGSRSHDTPYVEAQRATMKDALVELSGHPQVERQSYLRILPIYRSLLPDDQTVLRDVVAVLPAAPTEADYADALETLGSVTRRIRVAESLIPGEHGEEQELM